MGDGDAGDLPPRDPRLDDLAARAAEKEPETRRFFARLRRKRPRALDGTMRALHESAFAETDCLACANCCRTTSPVFTERDVARLGRALGLRPGDVVARYLRRDADDDLVLQQLPCPFLAPDNRCRVYDDRPRACADYPHTDRGQQRRRLGLTLRNSAICPAVFEIVEGLKEEGLD